VAAQTDEFHRALVYCGKPSELVTYPQEGQGVERFETFVDYCAPRWVAGIDGLHYAGASAQTPASRKNRYPAAATLEPFEFIAGVRWRRSGPLMQQNAKRRGSESVGRCGLIRQDDHPGVRWTRGIDPRFEPHP
jgi:hypothetical protein